LTDTLAPVIQAILSGLLLGGVYSIIALGVSLVWGVMKVVNFAHGSIVILTAYGAYWFFNLLGMNPLLSIFICAPLFFVVSYGLQLLLVKPIEVRAIGAEFEMATMIILFGLSIAIQSLILFFWKANVRLILLSYFGTPSFDLGGFFLSTPHVVSLIIALAAVGVTALFLQRTYTGKAIRATAQDRDAAMIVGVNVSKMSSLAFAIGGGLLAAVAGVVISIGYPWGPSSDLLWCIKGFIVVVLGGAGSIVGVLAGAFILGIAENLAAMALPSIFRDAISLSIFILIMLFRPKGVFGKV